MEALPKIQNYAVIGDGRSAALVSRDGSLAWLCWPRFDSPSLFGGLLDRRSGGAWSIRPTDPSQVERFYIQGTTVLQTRFHTPTGAILLTDFMPVASEEQKGRLLWPEHELVRRVECEQGEVEVEVHFEPRPDYGRARTVLRDTGSLGLRIDMGSCLVTLRSDIPLAPTTGDGMSSRVRLGTGQAIAFSLTYTTEGPAVLPPLGDLITQSSPSRSIGGNAGQAEPSTTGRIGTRCCAALLLSSSCRMPRPARSSPRLPHPCPSVSAVI